MRYNKEAYDTLVAVEIEYLKINGWTQISKDEWCPPVNKNHRWDTYSHGHAVNSQKYADRFARKHVDI